MKNRVIFSVILNTVAFFILIVAIVEWILKDKITDSELFLFFPLFYLLLAGKYIQVFHLGGENEIRKSVRRIDFRVLFSNPSYIAFSVLLVITFSLLLIQVHYNVCNICAIVLFCLLLFNLTMVLFSYLINFYLFWINLYAFLFSIIIYKAFEVIVSIYNPFGSLIVYVFSL